MSKDRPEIIAARLEAEQARARMMETARQLQERLSPGTIAHNAWEGAKNKGADLAEDAVDAVRQRPAVAGGIVAAIAMFLARRPLMEAASKMSESVSGKPGPKRRRKTKTKDQQMESVE